MLRILAQGWWTVALRGLLAVLFGLLALAWPEITVRVLVILFGAYVLVDGVFALISAFQEHKAYEQWWLLLVEGLVGVAVGLLTWIWPDVTALILLYFIAAWALLTGLLEILVAIRLRREIQGEGLLIFGGILSVVFGLILVARPGAGAVAVVWFIGLYALVFGLLLISLAFRLRSWEQKIP